MNLQLKIVTSMAPAHDDDGTPICLAPGELLKLTAKSERRRRIRNK